MNENFAEMHGEPWPGPYAGPAYEPVPVKRLAFVGFEEIDTPVSKPWIMKNVCAQEETSSLVGPPGSGKSACATDLCVHIAAGMNWRGYRSKGVFGVCYFAFERGDLLKRRLEAYKRTIGMQSLPFAVVTSPVDLMSPGSVDVVVATIRAIGERYAVPMGMLVIDTFAKAIAYGGGDENLAKDQNRLLNHIRDIESETRVHAMLIGHTGKDETRGARGSNAHLGDVDVMGVISGEKVKELTITKANDQPEGRLTSFTLESYEFGMDEDGDPITTAIVAQDKPSDEATFGERRKLSDRHRVALSALDEAAGSYGESPPAAYQLPKSVTAVDADRWRDELVARNVLAADDPHLRQSFYKLRIAMAAKCIIGSRDGLVWRATTSS